MNFKQIFTEYYTQFRGDSDIPDITDPEWAIAVRFGNTALRRLEQADGEDWEWLWTTASAEGNPYTYTQTSTTPVVSTYAGPDNMVRPGGWIKLTDPVSGNSTHIDVVANYNVQRQASAAPYAYWTGDPQNGFTLHISMQGNTYVGYLIDFPYYKSITYFNAANGKNGGVAEDGTTITECPDANFLVNYLLAFRYRSTRNYPSYQTAKQDAETALSGMQVKNRKGVDGHPWNLTDSSSGSFGI